MMTAGVSAQQVCGQVCGHSLPAAAFEAVFAVGLEAVWYGVASSKQP